MVGIKITNFTGRAPKRASELLADNAAQVATNCKLYSGDLIPYRASGGAGDTGRSGTIRGLYALRNPSTNALVWMSWLNEVDIATPSVILNTAEQAFYYTGDGSPKVSYYDLATSSATAPYPNASYSLGLPLPDTKLTATPQAVSSSTVSTVARADNKVTVVTTAAHGLSSGAPVTITGITDLIGTYSQSGTTLTVTLTGHGITNGETVPLSLSSSSTGAPASGSYSITVTGANTFTATMPNSATDSGVVTVSRRDFNATSLPVTVVNATTFTFLAPGFTYATAAVSGASVVLSGTDTLRYYVYTWVSDKREESINSEPSADVLCREGQLVTVSNIPTTKPAGNYNVRGVRLYRTLTGEKSAEFFRLQTLWFPTKITSVARAENIATITTRDRHMLIVGDRVQLSGITSDSSFNTAGATVRGVIDDYTFTFTQAGANVGPLLEIAGTLSYDVAQTKDSTAVYWTTSTFTDNYDSRLMFTTLQSGDYSKPPVTLKGLTAINNAILVGFVENTLYFSEPGKPHAWPVRYVTTLEHKIVGLAAISGSLLVLTEAYPYLLSGTNPAVMDSRRIDVNYPCVSSRSIVNTNVGVMYATHDGIVIFSIGSGPLLATKALYNSETFATDLDASTIVAAYYDDQYIASHSTGSFVLELTPEGAVFLDCDETFSATWYDTLTNKLYFTRPNDNDVYLWDDPDESPLTMEWKSKTFKFPDYVNLGAARVVADYTESSSMVFKLWVDKQLKMTRTIVDDKPFRLPTGYRTDTVEIGIEGNTRVRALHVAETVTGLKQI